MNSLRNRGVHEYPGLSPENQSGHWAIGLNGAQLCPGFLTGSIRGRDWFIIAGRIGHEAHCNTADYCSLASDCRIPGIRISPMTNNRTPRSSLTFLRPGLDRRESHINRLRPESVPLGERDSIGKGRPVHRLTEDKRGGKEHWRTWMGAKVVEVLNRSSQHGIAVNRSPDESKCLVELGG
jgi:hypothetical protein